MTSPQVIEVNTSTISIGDRYRKDLGDIEALAESIRSIGLLQPIGIDSNYKLIFGERRLRAYKLLGIEKIPARIIHVDAVLAEHDENEIRKSFTVSERVNIAEALLPAAREEASKRQIELSGKRKGDESDVQGDRPEPQEPQSRDVAAKGAGFSSTDSFRRAKTVVESGNEDLIELMDSEAIAVRPAAEIAQRADAQEIIDEIKKGVEVPKAIKNADKKRKAEERKKRDAELKSSALPTGKYQLIYADPPWRYQFSESDSREIENHYPTMSLDDICAMRVADIAENDSTLYLWTTSPKLLEAFKVIDAWGFEYKTCAVWDKQKIGMGYYFRQRHELLLVATKGSPGVPEPSTRPPSVITYKRGEHSAKPVEMYAMLESMYQEATKVELFCRSPQEGWAVWGNQSDGA